MCRRIELPQPAVGVCNGHLGTSKGRLRYAAKKKDWIVVWDLEDYVGSQWIWKRTVKLEGVVDKQQFESLEVLAFHPELYEVFFLIGEVFSCDLMSCRLVEICDAGDLELTQLVTYSPYYVENLSY